MDLQLLVTRAFPDIAATYTARDTMLYALGVGACVDPLDPRDLRFVYESDLQALPSMSSVLAHPGFWIKEPELGLNWVKLVHAEQRFELDAPLPTQGDVIGRYRVTGVVDKGPDKGALMYFEKALHRVDGTRLCTVRMTYFFRGDGGCGNWGQADPELAAMPEGTAAGAVEIATSPLAALLYRLSGDYNPLHADPAVAAKAGFPKPILHGLCTYGIACQSLVRSVCGNDASRLRSMAARFTKPVIPGETLRTEYWQGADGEIRFRCIAVGRNDVVLDRGVARVV